MKEKEKQDIFKRFYLREPHLGDKEILHDSAEQDGLFEEQWENFDEVKEEAARPDFDAMFQNIKGLCRNKLTETDEDIFSDNKAKNTGIAIATARLFNELSGEKNESEQTSYCVSTPKAETAPTPKFAFLKIAASIAAIMIVTMAAWFFILEKSNPNLLSFSSPTGERTEFVLPDGSKVLLNSATTISYPEDFLNNRSVSLNGEAYFDVVKNKGTFSVEASNLTIEVLGTQFVVSNYPSFDKVESTLLEGKIQVSDRESTFKEILKPNQQVSYTKKTKGLQVIDLDAKSATCWMDGKIVFDNTPLSEIVKQLTIWYGVSFVIDSEQAAQTRFTFTISDESLQETLDLISAISSVESKLIDGEVVFFIK